MFVIYESTPHGRDKVINRLASFDQAFYALKARPDCLFIEKDADHPGCADAFMSGGMIYGIEPENRRNL